MFSVTVQRKQKLLLGILNLTLYWPLQSPDMFHQCHRLPHFNLLHFATSHFRVTDDFEIPPTEPTKLQSTTRSKIPHICVTTVPESQIPFRFALRPAIFQDIFKQLHQRITPIMALNSTRSNVDHTCVTSTPELGDFTPFCSNASQFRVKPI